VLHILHEKSFHIGDGGDDNTITALQFGGPNLVNLDWSPASTPLARFALPIGNQSKVC
jgi:hypothetical protein